MGLVAVLGDIHGNKEAWDAVNRSIAKRKADGADITHYVITGDLVGYGPDNRYVVQQVYELQKAGNIIVVKGNHCNAVAQKFVKPDRVFDDVLGFKAPGAYEGINLAARQLCGDSAPIPPKPAGLDGLDPESDQYKAILQEWRKKQVEPYTQEVIRNAAGYSQQQSDALKRLYANAGNGIPLSQRFARSQDLRGFCIEDSLRHMSIQQKKAGAHYLEQHIEAEENEELRNYLSSLQHSVHTNLHTAGKDIPIFVFHSNPYDPSSPVYLVDRRGRERLNLSRVHSIQQVFADWDAKWKDVKVIFFGHSHIAGVYDDVGREDNGRLIVNPGTVGMPRGDCLEATYALWDPAVEGKKSVKIVTVKSAGWRMTREKMKLCGLPDKFGHAHAEVV